MLPVKSGNIPLEKVLLMEFSPAIEKACVKELPAVVPRSSLFPAQKAVHSEHSVLAIYTVFDPCCLTDHPHQPAFCDHEDAGTPDEARLSVSRAMSARRRKLWIRRSHKGRALGVGTATNSSIKLLSVSFRPSRFKTCIPYTYKIIVRSAAPLSSETLKVPNPATPAPREPPSLDIAGKEHMLQDIVEEVLA
ncbi:hypothetical protein V8E53_002979 [Lactarius tabidus]